MCKLYNGNFGLSTEEMWVEKSQACIRTSKCTYAYVKDHSCNLRSKILFKTKGGTRLYQDPILWRKYTIIISLCSDHEVLGVQFILAPLNPTLICLCLFHLRLILYSCINFFAASSMPIPFSNCNGLSSFN